jgi:hypothetical protein
MDDKALIARFIHSVDNILALEILIDQRVEELKEQLVFATSDRVSGLQTSIAELRRFKKIREIVESKNG